jgi:hypothetical protein
MHLIAVVVENLVSNDVTIFWYTTFDDAHKQFAVFYYLLNSINFYWSTVFVITCGHK